MMSDRTAALRAHSSEVEFGYSDETFLSELREGYGWQLYVGAFLRNHCFPVVAEGLRFRDAAADAHLFAGDADLRVGPYTIEVKSRRVRFTSVHDVSPRFLPLFVDTVSGFRAKPVKPYAIVIVSRPTGAMLVLNGRREREWEVIERFDRVRRINERFYAAALDLLHPPERLVSALQRELSAPASEPAV